LKISANTYCIITILSFSLVFAGPWPGILPGAEIGSGLPAGYEPSGGVWHIRLDKFFTIWDNGMVSMMDYDGTNITNWSVSGDLEGICVPDPASDFIYVGLERPDDGIKEFNVTAGQVTRFFNLTPWMQSVNANLGLEALTFVPDMSSAEGGYFYAGLQETGTIYIFELPIVTSSTDTSVTFIDSVHTGLPGISGLHYNIEFGILYAMWSYGQQLRVMLLDGTVLVEYDLPGDTQEGIALWEGLAPGQGQIFVSEDAGEVWRYDFNSVLDIAIVGNGSVDLIPDPPSYYGTYDTLTAIPDTGYQFVQWSGDLTGNENPAVLFMDYDKEVTATFQYVGINENGTHGLPRPLFLFGPTVCSGPFPVLGLVGCKILDITGRQVGTHNPAPGIYFIEVDGKVMQKIIKIK
jgi:hypothetical protein